MRHLLTVMSILITTSLLVGQTNKKILIVASNVSEYNHQKNGTYLMEIAIPFQLLSHMGYSVEIVTPLGGQAAIYHKGDTVEILKTIFADSLFQAKTRRSLTPEQVRTTEYAAIIFPGGYGHFSDVYENKQIGTIARQIYEAGGVIASLGHGTADLLNIRLSNGDYFVKGKTLTCFPTWAEKEFMKEANYGKLLPVDMEAELSKRGALLKVCTKKNQNEKTNLYVTDKEHRLVSAAFADGGDYVARGVAELVLMRNENNDH